MEPGYSYKYLIKVVIESGPICIADCGIRLEAIWSHHSKTPVIRLSIIH